jgi:hypothetical protein
MNIYELSRSFWDYAFENPDKIRPNHIALYFFSVEHCNRLGWKKKFGLPTSMAMEAIGIKSYNTYIQTFKDLVEFGFFDLIEKSKNQYSSNVIALSNFNKALNKALDKALIKHATKQHESTQQSIDSIDIPINNIQVNNSTNEKEKIQDGVFVSVVRDRKWLETMAMNHKTDIDLVKGHLRKFYFHCIAYDHWKTTESKVKQHFNNWMIKGNPIPQPKGNSNFKGF